MVYISCLSELNKFAKAPFAPIRPGAAALAQRHRTTVANHHPLRGVTARKNT